MSILGSVALKPGADMKAAADRVKTWTRVALSLSEETAVTVSEINCRNPKCPGVETVILVMAPGAKTRMIRIARPLLDVNLADLDAALE
jgi:hypothetical protein